MRDQIGEVVGIAIIVALPLMPAMYSAKALKLSTEPYWPAK